MIISGINFSLHFIAFKNRSVRHYFADDEVRFYLLMLFSATVVTTLILALNNSAGGLASLRMAAFSVVSIFTTTVYTTADFSQWPGMLPYLIFLWCIYRCMCRINRRGH